MKKQLMLISFSALMITAVAFTTANTQQEKDKNKKEQQQKQDKKQDKPAKADKDKGDKKNKEWKSDDKHQDKKDKNILKEDKGKRDDISRGKHEMKDGYQWDRETFKDRKKYKKQEKVTICHKFGNDNNEPAVTINVSSNALKAHMNHGDVVGDCPTVNNNRYSDGFLRNRRDYYNTVQNHYEQVTYSRSILDYANERLNASRQQLLTMQNNNLLPADIQQKKAVVIELEQNVSLLETLVGVAANLVVNKLQQ